MKKMISLSVVLSAVSVQANMIANGDFESGISDFTTDYTYVTNVNVDGTYTVDSTVPNGWAPGFGDHTSGSGNMMIVNASTVTTDSFWTQAASTSEGVEYTFSGWVSSLTYAPTPIIQLKVDGAEQGRFTAANVDDT